MAARGLTATIGDLKFLYCLLIFKKILPLIHVAHKTFQFAQNTLANAKSTLLFKREELNIIKTALEWDQIYNEYADRFVKHDDIHKPKRI